MQLHLPFPLLRLLDGKREDPLEAEEEEGDGQVPVPGVVLQGYHLCEKGFILRCFPGKRNTGKLCCTLKIAAAPWAENISLVIMAFIVSMKVAMVMMSSARSRLTLRKCSSVPGESDIKEKLLCTEKKLLLLLLQSL